MNCTLTLELDEGVLARLAEYAAHFAPDFHHPRQRAWCGVYLAGLLQDGERKNIEPLSRRVNATALCWPEALPILRVFSCSTTRPSRRRATHSVGVQRQYCGALSKKADCQAAVSLHYVIQAGHGPLGLRLFLPDVWLEDPARLDKAGVLPGRASKSRPYRRV